MYYGEKRDLETLDFQVMNVQQNDRSLELYYDEVNELLSLIANQIHTLIETYNRKAIDSFIRGLDGDVYKFIRNYEPTSLAAAYSYCISFQNIECRKMLTTPKSYIPPSAPRNLIPILPRISTKPNMYRPPTTPNHPNSPIFTGLLPI